MTENKILITGASGFLGWRVAQKLGERSLPFFVLVHDSPPPRIDCMKIVRGDLADPDRIRRILREIDPEVVIHMAAMRNTGACEKNPLKAHEINVQSVRNMLDALSPEKCRFIFTSTDLVFDGLKGNYYKEGDPPNPKMVYAQNKRDAESLINAWGPNRVVLRTALMYGPPSPAYGSFLEWLEQGLRGAGVDLFTDEYRTPLYVDDAADCVVWLSRSDFAGTLHLGGSERRSRYDFGVEFARIAGLDPAKIRPVRQNDVKTPVYRPPDVSLDSSLAREVSGFSTMGVREGIEKYLKETKG